MTYATKLDAPLDGKFEVNPSTGCWNWTSFVNEDGYGRTLHNGSLKYVHRISYEMHKGKIPKGLCVCHECDNRRCINPDHLWLGTRAENNADRDKKGRNGKHSAGGPMRISVDIVDQIRNAEGTVRSVAKEYGVSYGYVWSIKNRNARRHK